MLIKYGYSVFFGLLFVTFVGVGIAAFYQGPKPPKYRSEIYAPREATTASEAAQVKQEQLENERISEEFQAANDTYSKNVSIYALIAAVLALVLSLTLVKKLPVFADGLLIGGILTLIYSIIRGFGTNDNLFRFVVVSVGLAIALIIGYLKFVMPANKKR